MAGRRRARTGRGWDAKPPAPPRAPRTGDPGEPGDPSAATRPEPAPRDPYELAREICLRQLAVRPRTRSELATALRNRGVEDEVAAAVLDRYDEVGMIDDAAFARAWVSSRHHGRGLAARALGQELRRRGVDQETVTEALSELDDETQERTAYELAERKLRTVRGEPDAVFRRVVGMLARKGYPGGVAVRAVKEALAARSAADAELAELIDPDVFDD
ncbi:regulatory protein RecX [Catellatospora tritici]|uniref:regulatory protein RecX n=1 Tax=Catellatospora tritici TaxID=2851566 RepID=UPI001C2CF932|nr:regulatory protein RecX [Catellatospora tritici]MBV1848544.1 recombination regulator RecX [Catellatospora tritici]MBV1851436.1 recombination regulator RecX [Catellatospora tritici]